jgi:hypothetical protein
MTSPTVSRLATYLASSSATSAVPIIAPYHLHNKPMSEMTKMTEMRPLVQFSECSEIKGDGGLDIGNTNFMEGPDKPSLLFAQTIVSIFQKNKPLYHYFEHAQSHKLDLLFRNAIAKLDDGQRVVLWDGSSTKVNPTKEATDAIKECYVKYKFHMKNKGQEQWSLCDQPTKVSEEMFNALFHGPILPIQPIQPIQCTVREIQEPCLVPAGAVEEEEEEEFTVDDLEERLMRLMDIY